ncbi:alpha,alpha-trehalase TreF [Pontibacter vulgaris]|uniref:alpha,alpha-trehalase TreF n=1 Tax=Pontibacter vulgaris TaxID=2905679 RepID=UPI001FA7B38C|nr:alpha,alpha-trehalase TreF [Pontibacter vulgaris]
MNPLKLSRFYKNYKLLLFCLLGLVFSVQAQVQPAQQFGKLFEEVQLTAVFPDSKTFPDCIPLSPPEVIMQAYQQQRNQPGFNLKAFVLKHFQLPPDKSSTFKTDTAATIEQHIRQLWPVLTRQPEQQNSSLIPLPYPYVVPGVRFREIYYWDSYFTMLGLQESSDTALIRSMVDNFTYLIHTIGHIPNGNRSYYTSRSQPPFYGLMVQVLVQELGDKVILKYKPALQKEYDFWMNGANAVSPDKPAFRRVVRLPNGSILNRYWDDNPAPRPESFKEDVKLAHLSGRNPQEVYRHIRAAAESGWDFSSRWLSDSKSLQTIHTTDIIPVDLNALLYNLELTLADAAKMDGDRNTEREYKQKAKARKKALLKYCWSKNEKFFMDYDFVKGRNTPVKSLAAVFPLYFQMAKRKQAKAVAHKLEQDFLKPGGLVTTPNKTGEQWDAPNGWAPLQWMSIQALRNYGHTTLADTIINRWVNLNEQVYKRTGKLMEKYNVAELNLEAGGGEYPLQDGFGWTNGVLLKLLNAPVILKKAEKEKAGEAYK